MTCYWPAEDGTNLDVAPFVSAVQCATDRKTIVGGKPSEELFLQGAVQLGPEPFELLKVGGDIYTDIPDAKKVGLNTVLGGTGKFRPQYLESPEQPAGLSTRFVVCHQCLE